MEIGNKIRSLRHQKGYTQDEFANMLNVTPQAVSRWECGMSLPDITVVPVLAKILNVSCDELLNDSLQIQLFPSCEFLIFSGELLNQRELDEMFEERASVSDRTPKKVLIVDDSDFLRMMVKDILTKSGHTVLEADNGLNARKVLLEENIDVCLLDIKMPEMNGIDALEQYHKEFPNVRMIMLSALSVQSIVNKAYELGAEAFIAKPFQPDSLIRII